MLNLASTLGWLISMLLMATMISPKYHTIGGDKTSILRLGHQRSYMIMTSSTILTYPLLQDKIQPFLVNNPPCGGLWMGHD